MPALPHTRVVHRDWERHHRPVSRSAMTSECVVDRPSSTAAWDDAAGQSTYPNPERIYPTDGLGACRIVRGSSATSAGGAALVATVDAARPVSVADYTVVLPTCTALVQVGDVVTITRNPGDPDLVGRELRVTDSARGGYTWERILTCELQPRTTR